MANDTLPKTAVPAIPHAPGVVSGSITRPSYHLSLAELVGCEDRFNLDEIKAKTADEGLRHPAVFRCLEFLATTAGKLPIVVRRSESKQEDTRHQANRVLKWEANGWQSAQLWRELVMRHAAYWGNSVSYIVRDDDARPIGLVPFHPHAARLQKHRGELGYGLYADVGDGPKWYHIEPENVVHVMGFTLDGLWGIAFWEYHAITLGLAQSPRTFAGRYYARGTAPSIKVTIPEGLPPDPDSEEFKRFVQSFKDAVQGLGSSHNIVFLEHGSDAEVLTHNAENSQLVEVREVGDHEVCNLFGIDPSILGIGTQSGPYKSLEEKSRRELRSVDPWLCRIEFELRKKLLTKRQKDSDSHYVQFDRNHLVDTSIETVAKEIQSGGSTINEVRQKRGMEPVEGGDRVLLPSNVTTLEQICEGNNLRGGRNDEDPESERDKDGTPEDPESPGSPDPERETSEIIQKAYDQGLGRARREISRSVRRRLTAEDPIAAVASLPRGKIQSRFETHIGFIKPENVDEFTNSVFADLEQIATDSNNHEAFRKNIEDYCTDLER